MKAKNKGKKVIPKASSEQIQIFESELLTQIDALYTFAFHLCYNEADANDLVQETYLKAFRFIANYQKGTNAKAWLFKILKNIFINDYRKKAKMPVKVDYEDITSYHSKDCLLYTSPSPRDRTRSRMPSSA